MPPGAGLSPLAFFLLCAISTPAQVSNPEVQIRSGPYRFPQATISVQASLVESRVTVRDGRGMPVSGFTAADFEIFDNGRPQEITVFSVQDGSRASAAQAPPSESSAKAMHAARSLALFFDDTHASMADCHRAVAAAEKALETAQPLDRIGLFTGSGSVTEDFTTDREKLKSSLARIRPHWTRDELGACVTMNPYQAYSIARHLDQIEKQRAVSMAIGCNCKAGDEDCIRLQPAWVQDTAENSWDIFRAGSQTVLDVLRIVVDRLATMPESRILVMLSRGFVTGGMDREKDALVSAALRARIVVNALNTEGLSASLARNLVLRQSVLEDMMAGVSGATGGRYIKNTNDLSGSAEILANQPEVSYMLGFVPAQEPDGTYHALKIRLKRSRGYEVDARQGYLSDKPKPAGAAQQRIDDAVRSTEKISEIPATVQVTQTRSNSVEVKVAVDPAPLKFLKENDRSMQQLTFVMVLANAAGEFVDGRQAVMDLALSPLKLASLQTTGIRAVMNFQVAPGKYSIRAVVREAGQNRIAASSSTFEVR